MPDMMLASATLLSAGDGAILDSLLRDAGIVGADVVSGDLAAIISSEKPNLVVALGESAMHSLTGKHGILDWRGSVIHAKKLGVKVMPAIHPEQIKRQWDWAVLTLFDLRKAKQEAQSSAYTPTVRTLVIAPTLAVVKHEIERLKHAGRVAIDLETTRATQPGEQIHITALGLSDHPCWAMSIPFTHSLDAWRVESYWSLDDELLIWGWVRELLESKVPVVAHNAQFDVAVLRWVMGIRVRNLAMDTMWAMHTCYHELPKSLDTCRSLFTDQPYYDWWANQGDEMFWRYNSMDSCICLEVSQHLERELGEMGLSDHFADFVQPLSDPLAEMQVRGVRVDLAARERLLSLPIHGTGAKERLAALAGHDVSVRPSTSLREFLYKELDLPLRLTKSGSPATDTRTLKSLASHSPEAREAISLILAARGDASATDTYLSASLCDGRFHCAWGPEGSGRSIVANAGAGLTDLPASEVRRMFIPDGDMVLISARLVNPEREIVTALANDAEADDMLLNRGMAPRTYARECGIKEKQAKQIHTDYFLQHPRIALWHSEVMREVYGKRVITTPTGRKRIFFGRRGSALDTEAITFILESSIADVLHWELIHLHTFLRTCPIAELLAITRDEILLQCPLDKVTEVSQLLSDAFGIVLHVQGRAFTFPHRLMMGENWFEMKEL